VNTLDRQKLRGFDHEIHAPANFKFFEQRRNVKFHRARRNVEPRGDLFIAEILRDGGKHFVLTATERQARDFESGATANERVGATGDSLDEFFARGDQNAEIARLLLARHAVNREQARCLFGRHTAVISGFDFKAANAGFAIEKNEARRPDEIRFHGSGGFT
jgi:hypothetical protein